MGGKKQPATPMNQSIVSFIIINSALTQSSAIKNRLSPNCQIPPVWDESGCSTLFHLFSEVGRNKYYKYFVIALMEIFQVSVLFANFDPFLSTNISTYYFLCWINPHFALYKIKCIQKEMTYYLDFCCLTGAI